MRLVSGWHTRQIFFIEAAYNISTTIRTTLNIFQHGGLVSGLSTAFGAADFSVALGCDVVILI